MAKKKLNIGIIGGGFMGRTHSNAFRQAPECESYLRPGISMAELQQVAQAQSDTEAAIEMQQAKKKLLAGIAKRRA